jgi:DNA-binding response OmpR family regulator
MAEAITAAPFIALIEDEEHLAQGLLFNLQAEGYRTHHESDGDAALNYLLHTKDPIAAIVLDCMLPGVDGFTIVRALREAQRFTPVLMLTARSRPQDVLDGLDSGADDYLAKPFEMAELVARLKALLRRPGGALAMTLELGNVRFDTVNREAMVGERVVILSRSELTLLELLLRRAGRVVVRRTLEEGLYGFDDNVGPNSLEAHVSRLRKKLDQAGATVQIHTLRGVGYIAGERGA